jgi:biopolymer transport protein ExbB/TolQ
MEGTLLHHYTTEHVAEYVIVALTFWALVDVITKLFSFPRDYLATRRPWLPERTGREPAANAAAFLAEINERPRWLRESRIGRRFARALQYVVENGATTDYREQLKNLAHQDADRMHANYTLLRFVVRITPVLGFLGTVVHFGTALNGISFDDMSDKLPVVVSQMGQAFNTTTAALASAMFIMFTQFVCEWIDRGILHTIDHTVERELLNRFEVKDANILPFLSVVRTANEEALGMIAANLDRQTAAWTDAFNAIFARIDDRQRHESQAWSDALDALNSRHEELDAVREERLRQIVTQVGQQQDRFMDRVQTTLDKALSMRDDFRQLGDTLGALARGEGKLLELQSVLTDNLRVIHETQQIDDALHGLTAAIHLLTARHQSGPNHSAAA